MSKSDSFLVKTKKTDPNDRLQLQITSGSIIKAQENPASTRTSGRQLSQISCTYRFRVDLQM